MKKRYSEMVSQRKTNRAKNSSPGFTKETHVEVGKKLAQINADLEELLVEIRLSYGRAARASHCGQSTMEALDEFRAALYRELVNEVNIEEWRNEKLVQVYIGSGVERRRI